MITPSYKSFSPMAVVANGWFVSLEAFLMHTQLVPSAHAYSVSLIWEQIIDRVENNVERLFVEQQCP